MTPAEFCCTREFLGLSTAWLADHLGVSLRSVARWESGSHPIPECVAASLKQLAEEADDDVRALAADLASDPWTTARPVIVTYRTDAELDSYPASWHRMIAARVADATGAAITY